MKIIGILALLVYACMAVYDCVQAEKKGRRILKPFLMPVLVCSYLLLESADREEIEWLLAAALLLGCMGDSFLLKHGDEWTLAGLTAFLAGHILYLILFIRKTDFSHLPVWALVFLLAGYSVYAHLVMRRLRPFLPAKFIAPVIVYASVIIAMSCFSGFHFFADISYGSFLSWLGTVLFFISDMILAFRMFAGKSGYGVMETYVLAQFFIMLGFVL